MFDINTAATKGLYPPLGGVRTT